VRPNKSTSSVCSIGGQKLVAKEMKVHEPALDTSLLAVALAG
jgi:hypothetical protein